MFWLNPQSDHICPLPTLEWLDLMGPHTAGRSQSGPHDSVHEGRLSCFQPGPDATKLSAPKSQRFLRFAIATPIADPRNRTISETRQRGRIWARPPPRGLPRTTARELSMNCSASFRFSCVCGCVRSSFRSLSVLCILRWSVSVKGRPSVGPKTLRVEVSFLLLSAFAVLGAVP